MPKKNNGGFLITADHHCHAWLEGGEPVKGINGRIQDFLDATDFLFRYATVHEVEKIYHLGDVYHLKKNVPVDAYNLLWERYRDFMYQGDEGWTPELHFVAGNHDREDDRGDRPPGRGLVHLAEPDHRQHQRPDPAHDGAAHGHDAQYVGRLRVGVHTQRGTVAAARPPEDEER